MKKYLSFAAFAMLAVFASVTLSACGDKDDDDSPFNNFTLTVGGVGFTMVAVQGGTFLMGAPDSDLEAHSEEKPQHSAAVGDFYIGRTEVTQALWKAVMGNNPSDFVGDNLPVDNVT